MISSECKEFLPLSHLVVTWHDDLVNHILNQREGIHCYHILVSTQETDILNFKYHTTSNNYKLYILKYNKNGFTNPKI